MDRQNDTTPTSSWTAHLRPTHKYHRRREAKEVEWNTDGQVKQLKLLSRSTI
jgi:hypothetical protein